MGLRRYLTPSNWYSDKVEILLKRRPGKLDPVIMQKDHTVVRVSEVNAIDTQRFEEQSYTELYRDMLSHGDIGYFGYYRRKMYMSFVGEGQTAETEILWSRPRT